MRLENVLALTHGSLMSQPHISYFEDIVIEASRVKRGSLFIALNHYDIDLAISSGAYGVVYDRALHVDESEIALIKVDDIYDALKRLMRFLLIDKELSAFTCKDITLQVAKQLITPNSFIILEGNLSENFSKLLSAPSKSTLLFKDTEMESAVFTDAKTLPKSVTHKIKIVQETLFETSFIYRDIFYERQFLSGFFIPYLEQLLELLHSKDIEFKIRAFTNMSHFKPLFVNRALHVRDFGSTNRVVIFEDDKTLMEKEIEFILKKAPWAKFISLAPQDTKIENPHIIFYEKEDKILQILQERDFNYCLILGSNSSILENRVQEPLQQRLF